MLIRKIGFNIVMGFFVFPLLLQIDQWLSSGTNPIRQDGAGLRAMVVAFFGEPFYFLNAIVFSILILLPFQLIKDHYYTRGKRLQFPQKVLYFSILVLILITIFGSFSNIWWVPWYKNMVYVAYAFGLGLICTAILYFTIDQYVEKNKQPSKNEQ
jgi:tellurite resistance protein TehA-like permease